MVNLEHSVPGPEPSVAFGGILNNVMDVTTVIAAFGQCKAKAALFRLH